MTKEEFNFFVRVNDLNKDFNALYFLIYVN
jgi:hypothetical protein